MEFAQLVHLLWTTVIVQRTKVEMQIASWTTKLEKLKAHWTHKLFKTLKLLNIRSLKTIWMKNCCQSYPESFRKHLKPTQAGIEIRVFCFHHIFKIELSNKTLMSNYMILLFHFLQKLGLADNTSCHLAIYHL